MYMYEYMYMNFVPKWDSMYLIYLWGLFAQPQLLTDGGPLHQVGPLDVKLPQQGVIVQDEIVEVLKGLGHRRVTKARVLWHQQVVGLSQMLKRFIEFTGCPFDTAIRMVTQNTADLLCLGDKKGSITVGKDADLILLDHEFSIYTTIVAGRIVLKK